MLPLDFTAGRRVRNDRARGIFTAAELSLFLEAAKHDQFYIIFELAASTGMRQSEILALRWDDVDFQAKTISVRQAYTKAEKGHDFDDTKSDASERSISLFPHTIEMLKQHRKLQNEEKMENRSSTKTMG